MKPITRELLENLPLEKIVYAEYGELGAMGAQGKVYCYVVENEELDYFSFFEERITLIINPIATITSTMFHSSRPKAILKKGWKRIPKPRKIMAMVSFLLL